MKNTVKDIKKYEYYCPICKHPNAFINGQEERICSYCGYKVKKGKYSVQELAVISRLKRYYKKNYEKTAV